MTADLLKWEKSPNPRNPNTMGKKKKPDTTPELPLTEQPPQAIDTPQAARVEAPDPTQAQPAAPVATETVDALVAAELPLDLTQSENPIPPTTACPTCQSPLVNIVTGAVCPHGHAGLFPLLTDEQNTAANKVAKMSLFAQATQLLLIQGESSKDWVSPALYRLNDQDGFYRRVKKQTQSLDKTKLPAGVILSYCPADDAILWLVRWKAAEEDALQAFPGWTERVAAHMVDQAFAISEANASQAKE